MAAVALTSIVPSTLNNNANDIPFDVGTLVNVESRTWPGINKPGGVGRVISYSASDDTVDVKYVLGGEEKGIELKFVREHKFEGDEDGNSRASRRRRGRDENKTERDTENKKQVQKKRALKDASSQANQMKKDIEQKSRKSVSVKRKAKDSVCSQKSDNYVIKNSSKKRGSKRNKEKGSDDHFKEKVKPNNVKRVKTNAKAVASKSSERKKVERKKVTASNSKSKPMSHSPVATLPKGKQSKSGRWIPSPTRVLKNVYKDMVHGATSFVKEIVGKKESPTPSSPADSISSSLEIKIEEG